MYKTKMKACGLASKVEPTDCPKSTYCETYDFWIKGLPSKPITLLQCGKEGDKLDPSHEGKCTPKCDKTFIKDHESMLKVELKKLAKDTSKIEKCLNDGTFKTIASASVRKCSTNECNKDNCKDVKDSQCPSNPNGKTTVKHANGETTGKSANEKSTGKHANEKSTGKPANGSATLAPNGSVNGTNNGTTNAGTMNADEIIGINKFAITFFINAFLGSWVIIAFLF